jgi:hypothetical protein
LAFEEGNFPVKTPDLDIAASEALLGSLDRLSIVICVKIKTADDVPCVVNVVGIVVRHDCSSTGI